MRQTRQSKKRLNHVPAPTPAAPVVEPKSIPLAPDFNPREQALQRQLRDQLERAERIQKTFDIYKEQRQPWVPGKQLGVVLMVSWSDYGAAIRLLDWINELDAKQHLPLLLSVPHDLPEGLVSELCKRATDRWVGPHLHARPFPLSAEHWPQGPNWSFACASQWCHQRQWDFLLLEPDCVPLRSGWLRGIEREYRGCGRAFMGHYEPPGPDHQMHLAGVAVYQWETYQRQHWHEFHRAWDVAMGPTLVAEAHKSVTIQQDWGKWNDPPTFRRTTDLARIRPDALLFHRNKDGTLIQRLRETRP